MSSCKKLEKFYTSGKFDESLSALPRQLTEHLEGCHECRVLYDGLSELEDSLMTLEPTSPNPVAKARIRLGVQAAIENKQSQRDGFSIFRPFFNPKWVSSLSLVFVSILLYVAFSPDMGPTNAPQVLSPEVILAQVDARTLSDFDEYNESLLIGDFNDLSDTGMIALSLSTLNENVLEYANDVLLDDSDEVYSDDILKSVDEFNDADWDELRRYLS